MKKFTLLFLFLLGLAQSGMAQYADTTTIKYKRWRYHNVIITEKQGYVNTGYLHLYFPYAPEKEVHLLPSKNPKDKLQKFKLKDIESIEYANLKYVQITPENTREKILVREALKGPLNLYTFTERNNAPIPIPVAGMVSVIAIPYDNSLFFIEKDNEIRKVSREKFQKEMLEYVGTNEALAEKIKNKTYKYRDTETIVKEYNAGIAKN